MVENRPDDHLSASFKSLYKSIFGHSVCSGEYLNPPPLPPSSVLTDLGSSDSSIPLGTSALSILGDANPTAGSTTEYCPHFYTLMDSFRDIAERRNWDKLEPEQVQGLMKSFKAFDQDRLGLDEESYSHVSSSFEHFLQELSNRVVTSPPEERVACVEDYQPNLPGTGGSAAQPLLDVLPPNYPEIFPISGTSPPSSGSPPQPLAIEPTSSTPSDSATHLSPHDFTSSIAQLFPSSTSLTRGEFKFVCPSTKRTHPYIKGNPETLAGNQSSTQPRDPYENEDDDDFDWSMIM